MKYLAVAIVMGFFQAFALEEHPAPQQGTLDEDRTQLLEKAKERLEKAKQERSNSQGEGQREIGQRGRYLGK